MCPFKNKIYEHLNINFFKNEESDKMSAVSAHIQKTSEGESTNSPVSSSSHSPIIDTEYVSISQIQLLFEILCSRWLLLFYYYYENFSKSSFASLMIFDQLINLVFSVCFIFFHWV